MNNGIKLTPALVIEMAEQYKAGTTTTELSKKYGMSKATVCRGLRKMNIEPERKDSLFTAKDLTKEQIDSILLDFRSGYKITELSKKYSLGYTKIVQILEENNLWVKKKINKFKLPTESTTVKVGESGIKRILTQVERDEICEKYIGGPCNKMELAEEYGVHVDTISSILKMAKIATKRYVPQEIVDQLCEEFKKGTCTVQDLANVFTLSPDTVRYWLTKAHLLDTNKVAENPEPAESKMLSSAQIRKLAREGSARAFEILKEIADDPTHRARERITAAQVILDRAFGKPREEAEEEKDSESVTAKIMKLVKK